MYYYFSGPRLLELTCLAYLFSKQTYMESQLQIRRVFRLLSSVLGAFFPLVGRTLWLCFGVSYISLNFLTLRGKSFSLVWVVGVTWASPNWQDCLGKCLQNVAVNKSVPCRFGELQFGSFNFSDIKGGISREYQVLNEFLIIYKDLYKF